MMLNSGGKIDHEDVAWAFRNFAREGMFGIIDHHHHHLHHHNHPPPSPSPSPSPRHSHNLQTNSDLDEKKEAEMIAIEHLAEIENFRKLGKSHVFRGFVTCFGIGYSLQTVLSFLSSLISRKLLKGGNTTWQELIVIFGRDSVNLGLGLGCYSAIYKACMIAIKTHFTGKALRASSSSSSSSSSIASEKDIENENANEIFVNRIASFVAGGLAGLALWFDPDDRRHTVAIYMLSRTLDTIYEGLAAKKVIKPIPYGAALGFGLCQIPIMSSAMIDPNLMNKSYYNLILRWSGDMSDRTLSPLFRENGALHTIHENYHSGGCVSYGIEDTYRVWWLSFRIYLPLYVIPALVTRFKKLQKDPFKSATNILWKANRSAWFLAAYVSIMKRTQCVTRAVRYHNPSANYVVPHFYDAALGGLLTGLSLLFEDQSRHRELYLYVLPRAIEIVWHYFESRGYLKNLPHSDLLLFCVCSSVFTLHFDTVKNSVPEGSLMDRIFSYLLR